MENLDPKEITRIGFIYVEKWLSENGYYNVLQESLGPDDAVLRATGKQENILVQIKAFLYPAQLLRLNEKEIDLLVSKANFLNIIAYAAYVCIDSNGKLLEEINWQRLN